MLYSLYLKQRDVEINLILALIIFKYLITKYIITPTLKSIIMLSQHKSDIEKYYLLKKDLELPVKVRLYFLIFQNQLDHSKALKTIDEKKGFSKALINSFSNLNQSQKGLYLLSTINFVIQQLDRQQKQKTKSDSKVECDEIRNIETSCQMLLTTLKINYWASVSLKLDKIKKILNITNKKKFFTIDMKNYFVRKSNKYKNAIVLQTISQQINNQGKKYIFSFTNQIIGKMYEQMLKCCLSCQHQKLLSLMIEQKQQQKDNQNSNTNQKNLVFLNSKNINDYISYKQKVQKQVIVNKFDFKNLYCNQRLRIQQSTKIDKVFRMQNIFDVDSKQLKQKFIYALNHKNKYILESRVLQDFSKKYRAFYEKLSVNGRLYQYISIRQQSISAQEQILFIKGVENVMGRNYIEFIQARVRSLNPSQSKLIIYMNIGLNNVITKQVVKSFMVQFSQMIYRKQQNLQLKESLQQNQEGNQIQNSKEEEGDEEDDDDFKTVKGSQQFVGFMQDDGYLDDQNHQNNIINTKQLQSKKGQKEIQKQSSYLFTKYEMNPINTQRYHKLMAEHYLFSQWVRIKEGGVICTNEQIINNQKNLFKQAITRLGKNILKGDILKLSLPVSIFRKQSHLETIARNFCYAPMFFDKLSPHGDAIERVKYATLLGVSVGTLGISMQKPFNPILGQTIQLRIDGCPIYLEQISHHPPIGAYYFQGRGYLLHGQIEPKINFGFNNVKGYSIRPNYIQFQDNTQIQISFGKMIIKGMMFGDRQFNFEDRIFAYDKKNHIFSQVQFGPRKKSIKKKREPQDFFSGSIYKVKPQFLQRFNKSLPRVFPSKEEIVQQLSNFEGIWNDQVRFDDKIYVDFKKDLPYDLIPEQHFLLSNSSYRCDLQALIANDLAESQKQKQLLEQLQRKDRKLRQKYHR